MTEVALPIVPTKLTGYELKKEINSRFYKNKVNNNPDFYEKEKQRIKEYIVNRYKTDPEFAEKNRKLARDRYYRIKASKQEAFEAQIIAQSSESE